MIGYIGTGSSFLGCIQYCLNDKKELSNKQKADLSQKDGLQHHGRAEILSYNQCFGTPQELAQQFRDVAKLSKRVEKPVFHFSLRLAPGESLSRNQLEEIGYECAKEFRVADNQYICVLHKDTSEQHIHIVANRVGLDGKAASDSNSYKRMAALCRRLEKQYQLREVLSPRAFLAPNERLLPRNDSRRIQLQKDIRQTLIDVNSFDQFTERMKELGYTVLKSRGIAFIDSKKVKIKGSEVGFSLSRIEHILNLKQKLETNVKELEIYKQDIERDIRRKPVIATQKLLLDNRVHALMVCSPLVPIIIQIASVLNELLRPEVSFNLLPYELTAEGYQRRKKKEKRKAQHR
ncbi:relaxase/mobilization nuclease domain-containing protein [Chitinophaga arvensicola]|uniref:Relaxase/Mobilisation nuclease domain-containing protein n=1 Tax=Chitinophaga arvensicola TaxID=29529 RepID=A0A1I0QK92_9BACT|nr:relaxase/mobilization nuclease domain-containing protein [Chitinophaga arvensicola]SEW27405.1 Relaxase/Mobilisation nuclease domain-containing protein [Chitinophaga arvensicola]